MTKLNIYAAQTGTEISDLCDQHPDLPILDNPAIWAYLERNQKDAFEIGISPRILALVALEKVFPGTLELDQAPEDFKRAASVLFFLDGIPEVA